MRTRTAVMSLIVAWMTLGVSAHQEITVATLDDFRAAMIAIGESFHIVSEMVPAPSFLLNSARGDGLTRVRTMQRNLKGVRGFFLERGKSDGVTLADDLASVLGAVEHELTRATPDQGSAMDAVADLKSACAACHKVYREGTKETGFRFTRGAL